MNEGQAEVSRPGGRPVWGCMLTGLRLLGTILVLLAFAVAYLVGMMPNAVTVLLVVMAPAALLSRTWAAFRNRLEFSHLRHPFSRASRPYLIQCLNRWLFWAMVAITVELSSVPIQFEPGEYQTIRIVTAVLVAILLVCQLIPPRRVGVIGNVPYAVGWLFLVVEWTRVLSPQTSSDAVIIDPPFRGEWYVFQGGRSALVNHHFPIRAQSHALDVVRTEYGREFKGDPQRLDSYAAFGQPLFAPADGRVVRVVSDRPDVPIGDTDTQQLVGNQVVIEIAKGRYVLMAHLQKGSITVSEGEQVRRGQPVARCGNSGNTSAPHLHVQVQSGPDYKASDLRTYPIVFREVEIVRRGHRSQGTLGGLRRNDRIIPIDVRPSL